MGSACTIEFCLSPKFRGPFTISFPSLFRRAIDFNESYPSVVFDDNYSKHRVPESENGGPLTVNFSVNLVSIVAVDEPNQVHNLVLISAVSGINVTLRLSIYDKS